MIIYRLSLVLEAGVVLANIAAVSLTLMRYGEWWLASTVGFICLFLWLELSRECGHFNS